jgi:metallo-beta-lactamase family protein
MNKCKVCGRELDKKYKHGLCQKHFEELSEYGFFISNTPRTFYDPNEYEIHDNIAEMKLYDNLQEEVDEIVIVDLEDLDKIKDIRWDKKQSCITGKVLGKSVLLPNYILDTDEKIEHINGDFLDCRKENLKVVKKEYKKKKNPYCVSKKNKNKVIVEIIGKNKHQVTGSSTLVSIPLKDGSYKRILIELGGNQTNRDLYTEYLLNKEIVDAVPHNDIDYAFVLHQHFDHCGCLPSLIPNGFKGKVITSKENEAIMLPMLLDGAYIMNKNVKAINSKKHNVEPLYREEDVYLLMNKCETYSMNEIHKLDDVVSFQFVNAGHILGSCQLILYCKTPTGAIKKLHFTSDLGSEYNQQPFVPKKDIVTSSNFSMFEATYNDPNRGFNSKKEHEKEVEDFKKFILEELKNKRSILIGVFAQARQQTMMCLLYEMFKDYETFYPIYIDGVLGLTLNNTYLSVLEGEDKEYWKKVMGWKYFNYIGSYEKSMEVACNKNETKIVLSSGGMFSNGRIINHCKMMIQRSDCTFVITGYQGEGTIGHELQRNDNKTIKIEGMEYKKKAKVYKLETFSSHIQAMENIKYMSQVNTPLIVLNHSDENNKYKFRDLVEEELRKRNNSAKIVCASDDNNIFFV